MTGPHQPGQAVFRSVLPEDIDRSRRFRLRPASPSLWVIHRSPVRTWCGSVVRVQGAVRVKLMPHRHQEDRVYTVMSGVFYIGLGDQFAESRLEAYPPGGVIVLTGGTAHFHWAKSGEYVTQVTAIGPISLEYVNPQDDPRSRS